jgi:hypothetical protein
MTQGNPNFPIGTAAISWFDSGGGLHIRVYSSDGYNVTERCIDPNSGWTTGAFSEAGSQISATCWNASDGVHVRVYCNFQNKTTEWCNDPGSGWTKGSYTTV